MHELVQRVLKEFGVLDSTNASSDPVDRLLAIAGDAAQADALLDALYPHGIPSDSSFYDTLDELWRWISFGDKFNKAVGYLWARALLRVAPSLQEKLLAIFVEERQRDLFVLLDCLQFVLEEISLPVPFLVRWLAMLYKRVENDIAQSGLWNGIRTLCIKHSTLALDLLQGFLAGSTADMNQLAIGLLGIIRGLPRDPEQQARFCEIDTALENSSRPEDQRCWAWSWVTTTREYGLEISQLNRLLATGVNHKELESDCLISAVSRMLAIDKLESVVFKAAFQWVADRVSAEVSRVAKFHIADAARALQGRLKERPSGEIHGIVQLSWSNWIVTIQPVAPEDGGTWNVIERYLVELIAADGTLFRSVFAALSKVNGDGLLEVMSRPRGFDWLTRQMASAPVSDLVDNLLLSRLVASCRVGLQLFDDLKLESLDKRAVSKADEQDVELLFYEMQRSLLDPTTSARLLVSLLPRAEAIGGEFLSDFATEITLQVQNFPGTFRKELQRLRGELPQIRKVLSASEGDFSSHREVANSPVRLMQVPGTGRAAILLQRRMSRQISSQVEEHSTLLKLVKKVRVLYGGSSSSYFHGNLQSATPFVQQSSSFELPFVDYADPEMMAIRRLRAASEIQVLKK